MVFKKIFKVAPQTSLDIAFGPLSEMLGNHWCRVTDAAESCREGRSEAKSGQDL